MTLLGIAYRNATRSRPRFGLMLLTVSASFLVIMALTSLERAYNANGSGSQRLIVTNAAGYFQSIPGTAVDDVSRVDGVEAVSAATWFGAYVRDRSDAITVFASDVPVWLRQHPEMQLAAGGVEATVANKRALLVGRALADRFGWQVGQRVVLNSMLYPSRAKGGTWEFDVSGIFRRAGSADPENYAILHSSYFDDLRAYGQGSVGFLVVTTGNGVKREDVSAAIDGRYRNSATETATTSEDTFFAAFNQQFGDVRAGVILIAFAAFVAMVVVTGNAIMLGALERFREFSILKTLGFGGGALLRLILMETALVVLGGAALGAAMTWILLRVLTGLRPDLLPGQLAIDGSTLLMAGGVSVVVAMLVTVAPAIWISRVPTAEGLARC